MHAKTRLLPFCFALLCGGVTAGCASNFTIDTDDMSMQPPGDDVKMPEALKYSDALKEAAVDHAKAQFNIGQTMNGALMGSVTAATALLAFDGNQTAAAATGLGAGLIGLTDRFLLIDESLAVYKGTVDALMCGEGLLAPLAKSPDSGLTRALFGADLSAVPPNVTSMTNALRPDVGAAALASPAAMAVAPMAAEATAAAHEFLFALRNASDQGNGQDTAAQRLVLLVNQVRQSVNTTLLQKRATTEEIAAAFKKTVADYVKELDEKKKKAEQKAAEAKAAQQAVTANTAAIAAAQLQAVRTSRSTAAASALAESAVSLDAINGLNAVAQTTAMLSAAVNEAGQAVPDESKIQACLVKIAGGGSSGGDAGS